MSGSVKYATLRPRTHRSRHRNGYRSRARRLSIETLESRCLLATTASILGDTLTIVGDASDETIAVRLDVAWASLEIDDGNDGTAEHRFAIGSFGNLHVKSLGGRDVIDLSLLDSAALATAGLEGAAVHAGNGADSVLGTGGDDTLDGGNGPDTLVGAEGNDRLTGRANRDLVLGGDGDDWFVGPRDARDDTLRGGAGIDQWTWNGTDHSENYGFTWMPADFGAPGDAADDVGAHLRATRTIDGDSAPLETEFVVDIERVEVLARQGRDLIDFSQLELTELAAAGLTGLSAVGGGHADTLLGSAGDDSLTGGGGRDRIFGGAGNDTLVDGAGFDKLFGEAGDDLLIIQPASQPFEVSADGGGGNDTLDATGVTGNVTLMGADGDDDAVGGLGNDSLDGALGHDVLDGGAGVNICRGGEIVSGCSPSITLDASTTFQTMGLPVGPAGESFGAWSTGSWAGDPDDPAFPNYIDDLLDTAISEFNIDRMLMGLQSGIENDTDYWTQWRNGTIDDARWRVVRYSTVDDNGDPFVIDGSGYQFSRFDFEIDTVFLPMRQKLAAQGKHLFFNLTYVGGEKQITDPNLDYHHTRDPEEYAEFILATYLHMQSKYGFVPDAVEVVNEPDNKTDGGGRWPRWSAGYVADVIVATANRLVSHGFTPRFVAPSTLSASIADDWADKIASHPGVLPYLKQISYHLYSGNTNASRIDIANVADQYGLETAMLEYNIATHEHIYQDLAFANNSSWKGIDMRGLMKVDTTDPLNPVVSLKDKGKLMRQYMKFIQAGDVRIGATEAGGFKPVAFIKPDGRYVVVVKAAAGGTFSISGLPAGTYHVNFTTPTKFDAQKPDIVVTKSGTLATSIPRDGVITIYQ